MSILCEVDLKGLPPTVNHYYRTSSHGWRYKTSSGRKYQERTISTLEQNWQGRPAYTGDVELRIEFTAKSRRKWDIDNRVKALQDCLSLAGIIEDDSQVQILHVERRKGKTDSTHLKILRLSDDEE